MVKTKVIKLTDDNESKSIEKAAETIKSGSLVIYPTETSYGIAADASNEKAVKKVFKVKKRLRSKPIPVIIDNIENMKNYGFLDEKSEFIAKKFMPGPLTLIIDKKKVIPDILNPKEVAFRVSSHHIALKLSKIVGRPITATSANLSGQPPLYKIEDVKKQFEGKVDIILDYGDLPEVKPSTIVDLRGGNIKIIRKGPITLEKIKGGLRR